MVNPLDPSHIVGVEELLLPDGTPVISARASFDGGASWRESWPLPLEKSWLGVVGPVLAVDAQGVLNLAALALDPERPRATLVVYRSEDGGIHWGPPASVMPGTADCCYSIAADLNPSSPCRGHVYLAADMSHELCFARFSDCGSWKGKADLQPGLLPAGFCFNPEVLVDSRGAVHVVWMTGPSGSRVVAAHSTDGGMTFSEPVTIAEGITGPDDGLPDAAPSTCLTRDGVALCVWADDREGRSRIYGRRSTDGGRTWQGSPSGQPLVPATESGQQEFQPHLIVTAGGEICCAFYEYGPKTPDGELLVDLAMVVSYDRGATFTGRMVLSQESWDPALDKPLARAATRGALGWLALG